MKIHLGKRTVWHENQHYQILYWFWGFSIGNWHIGVQKWNVLKK